MAAVGCPRNCAEATVKDIGLVGQEGGWQVVVGGAAGKSVRKADLLSTVETSEAALEAAELFFQYYRENANYLERPTTSSNGSGSRRCGRTPSTRSTPSNRDCAIDSPVPSLAPSIRGSKVANPDMPRSSFRFNRSRRCSHERISLGARDPGRDRAPARRTRGHAGRA
jgi:hypothetical protein